MDPSRAGRGLVNVGEAMINSVGRASGFADESESMKQAWSTAVVVSALICCDAVAQSTGETAAAIEACARIADQAARLDCFDKLARSAPGRSVETAPSPAPAAAVDPQSAVAPQTAGDTPAPAASVTSRREVRAADRAEREVMSSVTALREIQPGRVEVTLANGQVWRQTYSDRYNLLVGHEVKIYPSGFGQYFRLSSTELRGFIQVERVK
jgi:hypothetical protein